MDDTQILDTLEQFGDDLSIGTLFIDFIRNLGWWLIQGMAWVVEGIENITDTMLGVKAFYENPEVAAFIEQMQPFLYILIAINIGFIGFLIIFKRDSLNRNALFANVFMALVVFVVLGAGMEQANRFTDDAIGVIGYGDEASSLAGDVITNNVTDVTVFDSDGWSNPDLEDKNNLHPEFSLNININSPMTEDTEVAEGERVSRHGSHVLKHKIETLGDGTRAVEELESGNWITDITQEYYYRYSVDWINTIGTLGIIMVVLVTISIKLARMFFEIGFNYVIAPFIAASDLHSGQRTKQVIQNILNLFLVTIMIFLSLKVYMVGASWLGENLTGIPYLIAMIGFGIALMNGPNMIERLFGIDGGSKQGWGAIMAGVAGGKALASVGSKSASMAKTATQKGFGGATKASSGVMGAMNGFRTGGQGKENPNVAKSAEQQMKQNQLGGEGKDNEKQQNDPSSGISNGHETQQTNPVQGDQKDSFKGNNGSTKPQRLHDEMKAENGGNSHEGKQQGNGNQKPTNASPTYGRSMGKTGTTDATGSPDNVASVTEQAQNEGAPTTDLSSSGGVAPTDATKGSTEATTPIGSPPNSTGTGANATSPSPTPSVGRGHVHHPTPTKGGQAAGTGETRRTEKQQVQQGAVPQKDVVDRETEVVGSAGMTQQDVRETTTHRNGGSESVQSTQTGGASGSPPSSAHVSPAPTPAPSGGQSSTSSSGDSTTTETTTLRSTTKASGGEHTHNQVVRDEHEVISDERHVGQVIRDSVSQRFHHSEMVKGSKQSYTIGKNTGKAIRRGFKRKKTIS